MQFLTITKKNIICDIFYDISYNIKQLEIKRKKFIKETMEFELPNFKQTDLNNLINSLFNIETKLIFKKEIENLLSDFLIYFLTVSYNKKEINYTLYQYENIKIEKHKPFCILIRALNYLEKIFKNYKIENKKYLLIIMKEEIINERNNLNIDYAKYLKLELEKFKTLERYKNWENKKYNEIKQYIEYKIEKYMGIQ